MVSKNMENSLIFQRNWTDLLWGMCSCGTTYAAGQWSTVKVPELSFWTHKIGRSHFGKILHGNHKRENSENTSQSWWRISRIAVCWCSVWDNSYWICRGGFFRHSKPTSWKHFKLHTSFNKHCNSTLHGTIRQKSDMFICCHWSMEFITSTRIPF